MKVLHTVDNSPAKEDIRTVLRPITRLGEEGDMARLLYVGTHGSDDPTKAGLVFVAANGATEAGHEPVIALLGEGALLMNDAIAASTIGLGLPPVSELLATAVANGTAIHI